MIAYFIMSDNFCHHKLLEVYHQEGDFFALNTCTNQERRMKLVKGAMSLVFGGFVVPIN